MKISINDQEHAAILAALRVYQRKLEANGNLPPADVMGIATNDYEHDSLDAGEIDELAERINTEWEED